jgi:hypothetical protein
MWKDFDETKRRLDQLAETFERLNSEEVQIRITEHFLRSGEDSSSPQRLDAEDKRKLHAEATQITNQRFLLNTAAVTLFGVVLAWLIPKDSPPPGQSFMRTAYAASILLSAILSVLFYLSHCFRLLLRTYSAYLIARHASRWEVDWQKYRSAGYYSYTKSQATLFIFLGVLTALTPVGVTELYSLSFEPVLGLIVSAVANLLYLAFVGYLGFSGYIDRKERTFEERWRQLLSEGSNP